MTDVIIVGGGAAGLAAAISCARENPSLQILVLERKEEPGKKILATGNGRCNITNTNCPGWKDTRKFFGSLGIPFRMEEGGRVYPYSEEARSVQQALILEAHRLGVRFLVHGEVQEIHPLTEGGFLVCTEKREYPCGVVLLAAGGKAGPALGTTGGGAKLARSLGHSVSRLAPGLTAVETREDLSMAAGCRQKVRLTLEYRKKPVESWQGELQITKYGISGICVFDLSRYLKIPEGKDLRDGFTEYRILVDFLPDQEDVEGYLVSQLERAGRDKLKLQDLMGLTKQGIASMILKKSRGEIRSTAALLKEFPLTVKGLKGWDMAQVTVGGVDLSEVNPDTQESKLISGLYFAGEVLDYDGPCGGYNLQFAWESGIRAGKAMAKEKL